MGVRLIDPLLHTLEQRTGRTADGACMGGYPGNRIAADLADKIRLIPKLLIRVKDRKRLLVEAVVDFLYLIGISKASLSPLVILYLSLLNEAGIHFGELVVFPTDSFFQIFSG